MPNHPVISRVVRAALFEDWLLKFICLVLAVLMWFYIDGELSDERDVAIALRPADLVLPPGYELSPERPLPRFNVRIRGTRRRLQLIGPESVSVKRKSIENARPGRNVLALKPSDLEAEKVEVVNVTPKDEEAVVELVSTMNQSKPVRVRTHGEPKAGYVVGPAASEPSQVNVQGSSRDLERVEFVWTEDVDITGAEKDVVREVEVLQFADANGRSAPIHCNQKVRVTVAIDPVEAVKRMTLDVRPITLEGAAMTIEPKAVEVEVVAEERVLASAEMFAKVMLYAEWPVEWKKPADPKAVLGPARVQVRAVAPAGLKVRGVEGAPLPSVEVRGALAGALKE